MTGEVLQEVYCLANLWSLAMIPVMLIVMMHQSQQMKSLRRRHPMVQAATLERTSSYAPPPGNSGYSFLGCCHAEATLATMWFLTLSPSTGGRQPPNTILAPFRNTYLWIGVSKRCCPLTPRIPTAESSDREGVTEILQHKLSTNQELLPKKGPSKRMEETTLTELSPATAAQPLEFWNLGLFVLGRNFSIRASSMGRSPNHTNRIRVNVSNTSASIRRPELPNTKIPQSPPTLDALRETKYSGIRGVNIKNENDGWFMRVLLK
ncbi:hypothetical protein BGX38DRAFT_1144451 [Terfezia claveryi]|nr:hypothetical protein BGX38DRAFT_1144451 [Terfezia claveryi]